MKTCEFHLYRVKYIKPKQIPLLDSTLSSSEIMVKSIDEKPDLKMKNGTEWHIGNISYYNNSLGSFAVGKTSKMSVEKYDKESGDFVDKIDDAGPYTRVIFDSKIGLFAIEKKHHPSPQTSAVANKLEKMLIKTKIVNNVEVEVIIDLIKDPDDFISKLDSAITIKSFTATFTGPNPIDADEVFQKPLSVYSQKMNAKKGSVTVKGDELDEESSKIIAKSTAATGNTASAKVIQSEGAKLTTIKMVKGPAFVIVDENSELETVASQIRKEYKRIRE